MLIGSAYPQHKSGNNLLGFLSFLDDDVQDVYKRQRLAESLMFLKESYGLEEDGSTLSIYLSREDCVIFPFSPYECC